MTSNADASPPLAEGVAYVDGAFQPVAEARIPVLDWGFLRSDAVYDVAHVWRGRFFRLDSHLERFARSAAGARLRLPLPPARIAAVLHECVSRSGLRDAYVEMICTRGTPPPGSRDPRAARNRFLAFAVPFVWIATPEQRRRGLRLVVASVRRIPPDSVDPTVKNYHWMDLTRGLFEAYERGGETVVLTDGRGAITEGPGFNVFAVRAGGLKTPAEGVLQGITRGTILELARRAGIAATAGRLAAADLAGADEVFLTSTAGGVLPVASVDGRPVGAGAPGPVTVKLNELYWAAHKDPEWSMPVSYGAGR